MQEHTATSSERFPLLRRQLGKTRFHSQDGFVDAQEVRTVYAGIRQEDLSAFFIASDKNEDGLISFQEYNDASKNNAYGANLDDYIPS